MTARLIDGKAAAAAIRDKVAGGVAAFERHAGRPPGLSTVLVGADPASAVYVRSKNRATAEAGMTSFAHNLPDTTTEAELLDLIAELNTDDRVDGILVQLPLPRQVDPTRVIANIEPAKDVDGFNIANAGLLATGLEGLVPCTPLGCLHLLKAELGSIAGLDAVVIGRSNIVGKPMALLLLGESATVTIAHSKTRDLPGVVRRADIVVAAVGRAEMVRGDWLKLGATVIDVGINRVTDPHVVSSIFPEGSPRRAVFEKNGSVVVGDVHPAVADVAGAITPVPGGVGPLTIAMLLHNVMVAAEARTR